MPAFATVILNDGTDNRFFKPDAIDNNGVATFLESTGVPIGDNRMTLARTRTAGGRTKVTGKLVMPVVQDVTVGGVTRPTLVRTAYADVSFSFDATSTEAERSAMRALIQTMVQENTAMIEDLETYY